MIDRRHFTLGATSLAFAGLALGSCAGAERGRTAAARVVGHGPLREDPAGLFDLPEGFSYRIISRFGDLMDDGFPVPDRADGMGAFALGGGRVALVRNHELRPRNRADGPFRDGAPADFPCFDRADDRPMPGGTTTLIYDYRRHVLESQFVSLAGTMVNCAGGTTPWGSWLSCEEDVTRAGDGATQDHGWIFEVPARASRPVQPVPLRAMGRFNHEAAAVDPVTGIVYLTEDRGDGLFYRFLPAARGELHRGGRLQALAFAGGPPDSRNWSEAVMEPSGWQSVRWVDLDGTDSPDDDLRQRGHAAGAALFARGEGIHAGRGEFYFTCTSGGAARLGQIFRYVPGRAEGRGGDEGGRIQLFLESSDPSVLDHGDNLTVAPNGHLIVCEDQGDRPVDNHLRGISADGRSYPVARLRFQTELAGACFSPDGRTLFVNLYSPTRTLAVTGPWHAA